MPPAAHQVLKGDLNRSDFCWLSGRGGGNRPTSGEGRRWWSAPARAWVVALFLSRLALDVPLPVGGEYAAFELPSVRGASANRFADALAQRSPRADVLETALDAGHKTTAGFA
jgi:hypothetical protein